MPKARLPERGRRKGVLKIPVDELRAELRTGQNRLADVEERLAEDHTPEQVSAALLLLLRLGELKAVPVGEHVSLFHVEADGAGEP